MILKPWQAQSMWYNNLVTLSNAFWNVTFFILLHSYRHYGIILPASGLWIQRIPTKDGICVIGLYYIIYLKTKVLILTEG
jgi:hypothetical protein